MKLYARARVLAMSPLQARAFTLTPIHRKSWMIISWCPSTAASMNGVTPVLAWAASMLARWSSKKLTKFWWSEYVAWNISVICPMLGLFPEQPASDCLYACPGGLQYLQQYWNNKFGCLYRYICYYDTSSHNFNFSYICTHQVHQYNIIDEKKCNFNNYYHFNTILTVILRL